VEPRLETNDTAVCCEAQELVCIKINALVDDIHLDIPRGIAVADTTSEINKVVLNLGFSFVHLFSPPFFVVDILKLNHGVYFLSTPESNFLLLLF
jgi:hypothetical protein